MSASVVASQCLPTGHRGSHWSPLTHCYSILANDAEHQECCPLASDRIIHLKPVILALQHAYIYISVYTVQCSQNIKKQTNKKEQNKRVSKWTNDIFSPTGPDIMWRSWRVYNDFCVIMSSPTLMQFFFLFFFLSPFTPLLLPPPSHTLCTLCFCCCFYTVATTMTNKVFLLAPGCLDCIRCTSCTAG